MTGPDGRNFKTDQYRPVVQHPMDPGSLLAAACVDRKGGDPSEWPEDLRVREFPR